jgi:hypothetical protein
MAIILNVSVGSLALGGAEAAHTTEFEIRHE